MKAWSVRAEERRAGERTAIELMKREASSPQPSPPKEERVKIRHSRRFALNSTAVAVAGERGSGERDGQRAWVEQYFIRSDSAQFRWL